MCCCPATDDILWEKNIFSHWHTVYVQFSAEGALSPFWSVVGGVGVCTSTGCCMKVGVGWHWPITEPWAQIRTGGREKRAAARAQTTRGRSTRTVTEWKRKSEACMKEAQLKNDLKFIKVEFYHQKKSKTKLGNWEKGGLCSRASEAEVSSILCHDSCVFTLASVLFPAHKLHILFFLIWHQPKMWDKNCFCIQSENQLSSPHTVHFTCGCGKRWAE